MENYTKNRFILFSKIYNLFFSYKKEIIVSIGDFGTSICVFRNKKLVDYIFYKQKDGLNINIKNFQSFLKKYVDYEIYFLLHNKNSIIQHEILPIVQNLIKSSPVESFIKTNISNEYTVSYNVISVEKRNIETWLTVFSLLPFDDYLKELMSYIITHRLNYGGIYHLQLESFNIFNSFVSKLELKARNNCFQIFITITQAFGLFILIKNDKHIIYTKSLEYSEIISKDYLQGLIEDEVSNCLLNFKSYITDNQLESECVLILPDELNMHFTEKNLNVPQPFLIPYSKLFFDFYNSKREKTNNFSDILIASSFYSNKNYPSNNNEISIVKKLTFFNKIINKAFWLTAFILTICIAYGLYKINLVKSETNNLTQELKQLVDQYSEITSEYKKKENFNKILDFYALNDILVSRPLQGPNKILQSIETNPYKDNVKISKIRWINSSNFLNLKDNDSSIIYLYFHSEDSIPSNFLKKLQDYVDYMSISLPNYSIKYTINKQSLLTISDISSIYVTVILNRNN